MHLYGVSGTLTYFAPISPKLAGSCWFLHCYQVTSNFTPNCPFYPIRSNLCLLNDFRPIPSASHNLSADSKSSNTSQCSYMSGVYALTTTLRRIGNLSFHTPLNPQRKENQSSYISHSRSPSPNSTIPL